MCDLFLYMKWRNMDVLVEQFCMNGVTRRNKHYAAQICQVIYFMVQTCNSSLLYQHLCSMYKITMMMGKRNMGFGMELHDRVGPS